MYNDDSVTKQREKKRGTDSLQEKEREAEEEVWGTVVRRTLLVKLSKKRGI